MRNITKSQPAPACLALEKAKKSGTYNCGDTFQRLHDDFLGKCYLCEDKTATGLNIEHFKPHFGGKNIDRKLILAMDKLYSPVCKSKPCFRAERNAKRNTHKPQAK